METICKLSEIIINNLEKMEWAKFYNILNRDIRNNMLLKYLYDDKFIDYVLKNDCEYEMECMGDTMEDLLRVACEKKSTHIIDKIIECGMLNEGYNGLLDFVKDYPDIHSYVLNLCE